MARTRSFLSLSRSEGALLLEALLTVVAVRLALWSLSTRKLLRLVARVAGRPDGRPLDPALLGRIVWAIRAASSVVPAASCTTQTLALQILLGRRGHATRLRIGVAKSGSDSLIAHAWVEGPDAQVIFDPEERSRYTPLPPLEAPDRDPRKRSEPLSATERRVPLG